MRGRYSVEDEDGSMSNTSEKKLLGDIEEYKRFI